MNISLANWDLKYSWGRPAQKVNWVVSDITEFEPDSTFDIRLERAIFHFLTAQEQLSNYLDIARQSITGYMTFGTPSKKGPTKCSGLDIQRYHEQTLSAELENDLDKLKCIIGDHTTAHRFFCFAVLNAEINKPSRF